MNGAGFTIGLLSARTGVKIETIRYYEKAGLLAPPPRSEGGHRLYGGDDAMRLASIKRCRELGFTLDEVRALLGLVDGGYTCGEVYEMTLRHQRDVKQKISDLRRLDRVLGKLAENCRGGDAADCPVVDALFAPA